MADVFQAFEDATAPGLVELGDVAYHIAAHAHGYEDALLLASIIGVGAAGDPLAGFLFASHEIADHRQGDCPGDGHHGRPCWKFWPGMRSAA